MATTEKLTFTGAQGAELAARLDLPDGTPRAYALFAHCFTCSKDIFAAARVSTALAARGIAVLRFDFTGLGHSDGEFANTNFSSNVGDLVAAAAHLRDNYEAPRIIIGHSLGGAAVLMAAGQVPEARAVATIGAPCDPAHAAENFHASVAEIEEKGEAEVDLAGRKFTIQKQFLDDIGSQNMKRAIGDLHKALIVFHAPLDATVSIDNAAEIYGSAKHPKSFVTLDNADHLLTRKEDSIYVAEVISAWATRYLGEEASDGISAPKSVLGTVVVSESGDSRLSQIVSVGGKHVLRADEPVDYGGADLGPTPYDLLLAGLGACTTMTVRMYAARKSIPLDKATVTLKHAKIHAEDCEACETTEGKVDRIERELELTGELSDEQRQSLLVIAEKCPVHRTLHSEVTVETRLKG